MHIKVSCLALTFVIIVLLVSFRIRRMIRQKLRNTKYEVMEIEGNTGTIKNEDIIVIRLGE